MGLFAFIGRIARHRWIDASDSRRRLGDEGIARLQSRVTASELVHRGEIRICVEAGLPMSYLRRGAPARERAITLFGKLRVWDTADNSGVLIYLLLAEHRIEIVADRGLNRHVTPEQWQALTAAMSASFQAGHMVEGLEKAVDAVHELLATHFPLVDGALNENELPDAVVLL
ncbi:MAG: hypothetical protein RLZZ618_4194 [Pseudomonadota bacterium]|jgi:uncharacterized membrane protein